MKSSWVSLPKSLPLTPVRYSVPVPTREGELRSGLTAVTSSRSPSFFATSGESGVIPAMETT